ncbi:hypothetical protein KUCAC02_007270 [Chaenocephalus aceratus]|uniref:Uncharacterized protein n=1 Tax=Chaenocephalus aceratus TaxID=36190 RepID=A0ACB9X517_CHAAC|nr:hypothetical protein KUCAC02_007270 [Chaenocephalus aceratus]
MSLLKQRGRELERFDGLSLIYWYVTNSPTQGSSSTGEKQNLFFHSAFFVPSTDSILSREGSHRQYKAALIVLLCSTGSLLQLYTSAVESSLS